MRAVFWVVAYLGVVLSPLVFAAIGADHPDHDFWTDFSVALGFVGLATMGLEFALVARHQAVAAPFGQDALLQFHRQIGFVGLAFVLVHFAISAHWRELTLTKALHAPLLVSFGMAALVALLLLVASSVWRRRLRLSYEAWHVLHTGLAARLGATDQAAPRARAPVAVGAGHARGRGDHDAGAATARGRRVPVPARPVRLVRPHGVFSMDLDEGPGFGLVAGGVGIAGNRPGSGAADAAYPAVHAMPLEAAERVLLMPASSCSTSSVLPRLVSESPERRRNSRQLRVTCGQFERYVSIG